MKGRAGLSIILHPNILKIAEDTFLDDCIFLILEKHGNIIVLANFHLSDKLRCQKFNRFSLILKRIHELAFLNKNPIFLLYGDFNEDPTIIKKWLKIEEFLICYNKLQLVENYIHPWTNFAKFHDP